MIKDEAKITLKNGNKGQKRFTKINFDFVGKKRNEKLTWFSVVCKGLTLVTLVWLEEPCFENYVEMVAGLPRNEQKMKIFCKSNKRLYGVYEHIKKRSKCNVKLPN